MTKVQLERLLNEACELLIVFENTGVASEDVQNRIASLFEEIRYSDELDYEMELSRKADDEAQDYETFGENKI